MKYFSIKEPVARPKFVLFCLICIFLTYFSTEMYELILKLNNLKLKLLMILRFLQKTLMWKCPDYKTSVDLITKHVHMWPSQLINELHVTLFFLNFCSAWLLGGKNDRHQWENLENLLMKPIYYKKNHLFCFLTVLCKKTPFFFLSFFYLYFLWIFLPSKIHVSEIEIWKHWNPS